MSFPSFFRRCAAVASVAVSCLVAPCAEASVILHVNGSGILTGASGVTVGALPGTYSVNFVDGTCAAVFGVCDAAHFTFHSNADATSASQALLSEVLVDSGAGQFDTIPSLTLGCPPAAGSLSCQLLTPYVVVPSPVSVLVDDARNFALESSDSVVLLLVPVGFDTSGLDPNGSAVIVWAQWVLGDFPPAPVGSELPEPGTLALLGLAGAALAWTQRRRRPITQVQ